MWHGASFISRTKKILGVIDCLTLVLLFFLVKQQLCPLLFCLFLSYMNCISNEQFRIFCTNLYDHFKNRKFFSQQPERIFMCHCNLNQWWKIWHFYCCPHSGYGFIKISQRWKVSLAMIIMAEVDNNYVYISLPDVTLFLKAVRYSDIV
jgi:hypothetical protein